MTGGQMAPTTLVGQKATTAPFGRDPEDVGFPMHMCELLNQLKAPVYIARVSMDSAPHIIKAKEAIRKGFQNQIDKKGLSIIEVLSTCPTNWGLSPEKSLEWLRENMMTHYPLGVYKDITKEEA